MKLKSFGCSFIYGYELKDAGPRDQPSQISWPALIARDIGYEYQCYARGGIGNLRIAESVIGQALYEPGFFIIGWSWIDRFDYITTENQWASILPGDNGELHDYFYRNLHGQYRDKLTNLMHIKNTLDILLEKNQRFLMTIMDPLLFETKWHSSSVVEYLQNSIRPYVQDFQDKTFLEWSRDCGFKISALGHPNEEAHVAAAEYALNHWPGFR